MHIYTLNFSFFSKASSILFLICNAISFSTNFFKLKPELRRSSSLKGLEIKN